MPRLIDADALLKGKQDHEMISTHIIWNAPTIDAEPVRHGRWEDKYNDGNWHCSVCGAIVEKDEQDRHNWNRCYHCGAKMDEVTE